MNEQQPSRYAMQPELRASGYRTLVEEMPNGGRIKVIKTIKRRFRKDLSVIAGTIDIRVLNGNGEVWTIESPDKDDLTIIKGAIVGLKDRYSAVIDKKER